jgi:TPR repeat protein
MWDVKAAEDGDREAQFKVAETYQHGSSVVQASMPAAAKMYEAAAKQGHLEAARRYAHCLLDGNGVDKDAAAAVEWFGIAAEGGHVDAQFQLGLCYHAGTGTAKDLDLTIKWLQKAGEQRNVEAQYRLGMIFQQSISADQVSPLNAAWYPPTAWYSPTAWYPESHSIAPAMVSSTFGILPARHGIPHGAVSRTARYPARRGIPQESDFRNAHKWILLAAEQEHAAAEFSMGMLYEKGIGVRPRRCRRNAGCPRRAACAHAPEWD